MNALLEKIIVSYKTNHNLDDMGYATTRASDEEFQLWYNEKLQDAEFLKTLSENGLTCEDIREFFLVAIIPDRRARMLKKSGRDHTLSYDLRPADENLWIRSQLLQSYNELDENFSSVMAGRSLSHYDPPLDEEYILIDIETLGLLIGA